MRYTPEGKAVTELRVANTEQREAEFHDLVAYGRLAEILGEHLRSITPRLLLTPAVRPC